MSLSSKKTRGGLRRGRAPQRSKSHSVRTMCSREVRTSIGTPLLTTTRICPNIPPGYERPPFAVDDALGEFLPILKFARTPFADGTFDAEWKSPKWRSGQSVTNNTNGGYYKRYGSARDFPSDDQLRILAYTNDCKRTTHIPRRTVHSTTADSFIAGRVALKRSGH